MIQRQLAPPGCLWKVLTRLSFLIFTTDVFLVLRPSSVFREHLRHEYVLVFLGERNTDMVLNVCVVQETMHMSRLHIIIVTIVIVIHSRLLKPAFSFSSFRPRSFPTGHAVTQPEY